MRTDGGIIISGQSDPEFAMSSSTPRAAVRAVVLVALVAGFAVPHAQAAAAKASAPPAATPAATASTPAAGKTGEFWEMKQSMRMEGMSMPAMTNKVCVPKNPPSDKLVPKGDDNCKTTSFKQSGNKVRYSMVCTGKDAMSGEGEFEQLGPDAYRGRTTLHSSDGDMTMEFEGRKVGGACDPEEPMKRAQAQMGAAMADACRDRGRSFMSPENPPEMPAGADMGCTSSNKAAYCEGVRESAKDVDTRSEFSSLTGNPGWRKAFSACGLDAAALERKFCGSAVKEKDWYYVAESCETDARSIAARCAGRDMTSLSAAGQSDLLPICQKYGPGAPPVAEKPEGDAASGQVEATPAKPSALDKLKKGTKGLGDLFRVPRP